MSLDRDTLAVLACVGRLNFWAFCCYWDWDFFHERRHFLKSVASAFQEIIDSYENGVAIKVSVSMPPRAGKSYITSLFAAYWLGRFPSHSVMRNTCTTSLYEEFSYATRAIILDRRYCIVFPSVRLRSDKKNLSGWSLETSIQVGYFGSGVDGSIIGKGANLAITDDLYKGMGDAMSDTVRNRAQLWKQSEHDSRLEKNCPEIFIGTRWVKDDIIGTADVNFSVVIPALDSNSETFCDDVKSTEEYLKIRDKLLGTGDDMTWWAEYMQQPIDVVGLLLPRSELLFDDFVPNPSDFSYRFAVIDPADKGGDKYAVPFCFVTQTSDGIKVYVIDALCNTNGLMANTPRVVYGCSQYMIDDLFVEANGVGNTAVLDLGNNLNTGTNLNPFTSSEQKEVRILSNYEFIRRYFIFRNLDGEYGVFMDDLTGYIKGGQNSHKKDAIDVLSRAAEIVKLRFADIIYG